MIGHGHQVHLPLLAAYLTRARQLDQINNNNNNNNNRKNSTEESSSNSLTSLVQQLVTLNDAESHYTPLHWAIYRGDLPTILLLLQQTGEHSMAMSDTSSSTSTSTAVVGQHHPDSSRAHRFQHKPMEMLEYTTATMTQQHNNHHHNPSSSCWQTMVMCTDAEGLTPGQLLAALQRTPLRACRAFLKRQRPPLQIHQSHAAASTSGRQPYHHRRTSSYSVEDEDHLRLLQDHGRVLLNDNDDNDDDDDDDSSHSSSHDDAHSNNNPINTPSDRYGCEVLTFGRAHHCALGVGTDQTSTSHRHNHKHRPQRVQQFALSQQHSHASSAVAVAAAAHHTMVLTQQGHVYAFGLNKGGRLGTGHEHDHSPLPTRIALTRRVVAIAAAENHSLAVTQQGHVYAWGSNRFGQLGMELSSSSSSSSSYSNNSHSTADHPSTSCVLVPRRVDDLKDVFVRAIAAGEKHSVALSSSGGVYVWGDNSSGQLGLPPRKQQHYKVQKVEGILSNKVAIEVSASEFSTLILTLPPNDQRSALPVNAIYSFGHGNQPFRVHLHSNNNADRRPRGNSAVSLEETGGHRHRQQHSPIAIASAKYHSVAVTQTGLVYTWGLHAEVLGSAASPKKKRTDQYSSPQVVQGMLPENGGGWAVDVSASENHTAVLTDTGALYTFGATHGPNILGHEGVRFQPDPKRVPNLYRGVAVCAAKEHFVVLAGTCFPPPPKPSSRLPTLEELSALRVMQYVDLFNALPILITAERSQNNLLIDYCVEFCKKNLDGVLNVAQRSVVECYLREQLQTHVLRRQDRLDDFERREAMDAMIHPILLEFVVGTCAAPQSNDHFMHPMDLPSFDDWMQSTKKLTSQRSAAIFLHTLQNHKHMSESNPLVQRPRTKSTESSGGRGRARSVSFGQDLVKTMTECSARCAELTQSISDLETSDDKVALQDRRQHIMKEVRALRKRLSQIAKLESERKTGTLSHEQLEKVARKAQLQLDLDTLEPAMDLLERRLKELTLTATKTDGDSKTFVSSKDTETAEAPADESAEASSQSSFRCDICGIACSDKSNYSLHMNGRKHRNRVAQVEEEARARKAAELLEEKQRESLKLNTSPHHAKVVKPANPWKSEPKSPGIQPNFKLPPPPHEVPSTLTSPSTSGRIKPASLIDIMAKESKASPLKKASRKAPPPSMPALGAAKSPGKRAPTKSISPRKKAPAVATDTLGPQPVWQTLHVKNLPALDSPPWMIASTQSGPSIATKKDPRGDALSLMDFVTKKSPPPTTPTKSKPVKTWSTPPTKASGPNRAPPSTPAFAIIQQEELAKKDKRDPAYLGGEKAKWFVESRDRADSLTHIQKTAEKEREDRLFLEEQFKIEKMIQEERDRKKQTEEAQHNARSSPDNKGHNRSKKRNPKPKSKVSTSGNQEGNNSGNRNQGKRNNNSDSPGKPKNNPQRRRKPAPINGNAKGNPKDSSS